MRPVARLGPTLLIAALLALAGCVAYPVEGYAPGYYAPPPAVVVGGGWGYRGGGWGYPGGGWGRGGSWGGGGWGHRGWR